MFFKVRRKTKYENRNSHLFFKVRRKRKTKSKIQIRFLKRGENVQKSNPVFNVTGK